MGEGLVVDTGLRRCDVNDITIPLVRLKYLLLAHGVAYFGYWTALRPPSPFLAFLGIALRFMRAALAPSFLDWCGSRAYRTLREFLNTTVKQDIN